MPKEKSYGAVVFRQGAGIRYLILQYGTGHWDLMKGHAERGENERETVIRELEEETGITRATFIPGFREEIHYFFQRRKRTIYKEVVYYLVETPDEGVVLSDEHTAYQWLPYEEVLGAITFENSKWVIKKAHERLKVFLSRKSG